MSPTPGEVHADLPASAKGKASKNFRATVPVYFHVVTDGTTGALTDAQIAGQIAVLNNTFSAGEGGAATGFSFRLAGVTSTDNADWFYGGIGGDPRHHEADVAPGWRHALNLYSTTAGAYLGWAYLPDIVTKRGQPTSQARSRLGVDARDVDHFAGNYDRGETATHEVGHGEKSSTRSRSCGNARGDFVDDTPAQKTPTSGCARRARYTWSAPGWTPSTTTWTNPDDTNRHTQPPSTVQVQRMKDAWLLYRRLAVEGPTAGRRRRVIRGALSRRGHPM